MRRSCPNVIFNGLVPTIVFLLAIVPLCPAQYLWRDTDLQRPNENHVIDRVFSGNTPFLGWRIYDDQEETTALSTWTWKFYYSMDRDDLEGGWELTGTNSGNTVIFDGGTNVFFRPYDRYYFSLRATSAAGQVRTVANGRMIQEHDPAAGDLVAGTWVEKFTYPDEDGLLYGIRDKEWATVTAEEATVTTGDTIDGDGSAADPLDVTQSIQDGATAGGTALQPDGDGSGLSGITAAQVGASPTGHSHIIGDVTGLQAELDGKAGTGTVAAIDTRVTGIEGGTNNWTEAYNWGDHALAGYLTAYTETDPIWGAVSNTITTQAGQGATAYGWGDHALAGYLTSFTETDPVFTNWFAGADYTTVSNRAFTAWGWGDHALAGYLTAETDPVFTNWLAGADYVAVSNAALMAYAWGDWNIWRTNVPAGSTNAIVDGALVDISSLLGGNGGWVSTAESDLNMAGYSVTGATDFVTSGGTSLTGTAATADAALPRDGSLPMTGNLDVGANTLKIGDAVISYDPDLFNHFPLSFGANLSVGEMEAYVVTLGGALEFLGSGQITGDEDIQILKPIIITGDATADNFHGTLHGSNITAATVPASALVESYTTGTTVSNIMSQADSTPYAITRASGTATVSRVNGNSQSIAGTNTFHLAIEPGDAATASIIYLAIEHAGAMSDYQTNNVTWSTAPTATNGMYSIVLESDLWRTNWYGTAEARE